MKKPSPFTLWDFLTFGSMGVGTTLAAAYIQFWTKQDLNAYALMWTCAAAFWFCYSMLVRERWLWTRTVAFVTDQGLCVIFKDGFSFTKEEIETSHTQMMDSWQKVINDLGAKQDVRKAFLPNFFGDYAFVTFKQGPLTHSQYYNIKLAGYTVGRACVIGVNDKSTTLEHTAFQHELGHVVYSSWKGFYQNNDEEHAFIKARGLR